MIGLEQSRTPADLIRVADALPEWLAGSENVELRRVFVDWLTSSIGQFMPAGEELPVMESLEEVRMTLKERLREWPAQWMREGREQGLEQGLERGLEHERALLCRMAALRFGAEASERLAVLLANVAEADRLADIGDRLVQCRAADEFLTQAELLSRGRDGRQT